MIDTETTHLKLSTLTEQDFIVALNGIIEVRESLRADHGEVEEPPNNKIVEGVTRSLQNVVIELGRINERLGKLESQKAEEPIEEAKATVQPARRPPPEKTETKARTMARKAKNDREDRKRRSQLR